LATAVTNRGRIRLLVSLLPGVHLRQLQRLTGLSFNSTRYHVQVLERTGEIVRTEEGGYSRLFPVGTNDLDKALFSVIRRTTDREILTCMTRVNRISHTDLCNLTGFAKSTISEHLARLMRIGIVTAKSDDTERIEYELTDPVRVKTLLSVESPTLLRRAGDRFIDLWDF
jgi:predicted transcriptional regulator